VVQFVSRVATHLVGVRSISVVVSPGLTLLAHARRCATIRDMEPYRDDHRACPRCNAALREFRERLVCDACEGMMIAEADLCGAIVELTSLQPTLVYRDGAPGKRACPQCSVAMTTARLTIELEGEKRSHAAPELDRCATHGLWFDESELAAVLEKVAGKGLGGGSAKPSGGTRGGAAPRSFTFNLGGRGWAS